MLSSIEKTRRILIIGVFSIIFIQVCSAQSIKKIKIACIGNSITYGYGIEGRETNSYPAQLQTLLGKEFEVTNFGVSATTLLTNGNNPYIQTPEYQQALESNPDIVFIKLGTNDSKQINRRFYAEF